MKDTMISNYNSMTIVILAISGTTLVVPFARDARNDMWLAMLIGLIGTIMILWVYSKILSIYPGKNLLDILDKVYYKPISIFIILLYSLFAFIQVSSMFRIYGEFVVTASLPETPMGIAIILLTVLAIFMAKEGLGTLGQWSSIFFLINAPLPSIIVLSLIPQMDISNLKPFLYDGMQPLISSSLSTMTLAFCNSCVLTLFLFSFDKTSPFKKVYLPAILLAGFLTIGVTLTTVMVLGPNLYYATVFPTHNVATKIGISELVNRLEAIIVVSTISAGFLKGSLALLVCTKGLAKIFSLDDYRILVTPIGLLVCSFSFIIYKNIFLIWDINNKIYPFLSLPFVVIIPVLTMLIGLFKTRKKGSG